MVPDKVELAWDEGKHKWLVRIEAGTEVIRRPCKQARDADEQQLRAAARQTVIDEGYEVDASRISVVR
jgi:hypothetical protein